MLAVCHRQSCASASLFSGQGALLCTHNGGFFLLCPCKQGTLVLPCIYCSFFVPPKKRCSACTGIELKAVLADEVARALRLCHVELMVESRGIQVSQVVSPPDSDLSLSSPVQPPSGFCFTFPHIQLYPYIPNSPNWRLLSYLRLLLVATMRSSSTAPYWRVSTNRYPRQIPNLPCLLTGQRQAHPQAHHPSHIVTRSIRSISQMHHQIPPTQTSCTTLQRACSIFRILSTCITTIPVKPNSSLTSTCKVTSKII